MPFNLPLTLKNMLFSGVITLTMNMPSWAEVVDVEQDNLYNANIDNALEDKLYRQALYFYFTGNYSGALRKISLNRQQFNASSSRSDLFEAGLQVTVGLHHQATKTLYKLEKKQVASNNKQEAIKKSRVTESRTDKGASATSPAELLLIALLQLAEQQIQQGENKSAQQTLSKITQISTDYSDQYHILNQLAYWPEPPMHLAKVSNNKDLSQQSLTSAYVSLNQALLHIEQDEFVLAKRLLTGIKNKHWQAPVTNFWQRLFNPASENVGYDTTEGVHTQREHDKQNQQQAVNDYAKLLLAQMYVKQTRYESAYYELKNFPQDSPYTESALFIFAFSAQKIKQYTTSFKLLDLMQERYPYSNLGWQAILLLAAQVTDQKTLEEGMTSYQNAEQLYQQRLTDLASFHRAFMANDNVLNFGVNKTDITVAEAEAGFSLFTQHSYTTDSVWLQKALFDVELQADYQTLLELELLEAHLQAQQQTSQWLQDTLLLNNERKTKIIALQQHAQYSATIAKLMKKKDDIAEVITQADIDKQGRVFANQAEAQWLKRIAASKKAITALKNYSTTDYQERLTRIERVFAWQLQQAFPDRLWQHKKQLKAIDQQLLIAEQQRKRFAALADSQSLLSGMEDRIQDSSAKVTVLLKKVAQLSAKTREQVHTKVQRFVDQQGNLLEQYLLTTRHEMAAVLEQMSQVDKRMELQLAPSAKGSNVSPESKEQL